MANNERVHVGLFIDWDNLAISTAADLGGAMPDVKAVVQRAQQFGTIVIAKAYAEWQATSDRLAVYRTGVEPVYAPTFRFEPDTPTQQGKGKSLADPCMVADCVDTLHLFPDINTYVLVTGDKDMIPVVRLAQLRGRRVVVIGPDYVAAVLREMADEFIPYRSLVEGAPARAAEPARRYPASRHPSAYVRPEKQVPVPVAPSKPKPLMEVRPPVVEPEEVAPPVEERGPVPAEDLNTVFRTVEEILRQRHDEGRDRIRATNLKDALMQRMPGFSERKLGFAKFKDLLRSAEKAGLIQVIAAGPVHWIALPSIAAQPPAPVSVELPTVAATPPPPEQIETSTVEAQLEAQRADMIRFISELRDRSRWLTYTYVLTNLISYYARTLPQSQAEDQARAMLNYLVQEGVLRVDREPQEVEVGGARHRVRMCHLNTDHELVAEILGAAPDSAAAEPTVHAYEGAGEIPSAQAEGQPADISEPPARPEPAAVEDTVLVGNGSLSPPQGEAAVEESAVIAEGAVTSETAAGQPIEEPASSVTPPANEVIADEETSQTPPVDAGTPQNRLARAYEALRQVLERDTSERKPVLSASSLRARLAHELGSFNERELGFPRFKDFLVAAEEAGVARTTMRGHVTLVGPVDPKQV